MSDRRPLFDAPEPVVRAAGAWLARCDRGLTPAEQAQFERWRAADPSHAAAVAQLEQTMTTFDALRQLAPESTARPDPDALAPRGRARPRRVFATTGAALLLAAAAVAIVLTRFDSGKNAQVRERFAAQENVDRVTLPDRSTVLLNRGTEVEVEFTADERRVRLLHGEAHFQVTSNPARPFVVLAGAVRARAVGTAFNVRLGQEGVEVLVTEGKVAVSSLAASPRASQDVPALPAAESAAAVLPAGFRARVATSPSAPPPVVVQLDSQEIERELAWQPPFVDLENVSLEEIVGEINRRSLETGQPRLVLGDDRLRRLKVGGTLRLTEPAEFARLLEKSLGLQIETREDAIVLRRAR